MTSLSSRCPTRRWIARCRWSRKSWPTPRTRRSACRFHCRSTPGPPTTGTRRTKGMGPAPAASALDGAAMSWPWALPFAGILLSIAAGPLLFRRFWHDHYGKVAAAWAALSLVPTAVVAGPSAALDAFLRAMLTEYLSFIVLLLALYTVAGGILVSCQVRSSPATNGIFLLIGTLIASFVGTT